MKAKQRNIRVLEIECENYEEAVNYLQKNIELFKTLTLLIKGDKSLEVFDWATANGFSALISNSLEEDKRPSRQIVEPIIEQQVVVQEKEVVKYIEIKQEPKEIIKEVSVKRTVINRVLRSGESIDTNSDVVIFGRINSGAIVKTTGSVEIFDEIDGLVECSGDYMILRSIGKGSVLFQNENIKKESLKFDLQKIFFDGPILTIKRL